MKLEKIVNENKAKQTWQGNVGSALKTLGYATIAALAIYGAKEVITNYNSGKTNEVNVEQYTDVLQAHAPYRLDERNVTDTVAQIRSDGNDVEIYVGDKVDGNVHNAVYQKNSNNNCIRIKVE